MSAVIETIVNDQLQKTFWIEKGVTRIGSGADCDLRLDGSVPSHLATLRFRNGEYVLYNRGGSMLDVGGRPIDSDGSGPWRTRERVSLTRELSLQLVVDGNPAPSPCPDTAMLETYQRKRQEERRLKSVHAAEVAEEAAEALAVSEKTAGRSSATSAAAPGILLLGAVLLGLAGFAGWLILDAQRGGGGGFDPRGVANNLLARSEELPPQLVHLLQETQQSVELLDAEMARSRLHRLRTELERLKADGVDLTIAGEGEGAARVSYEEALRAYINEYLSLLE